jgi:hypothetical protein
MRAVAPEVVFVPTPLPRMWVNPTNPSKSVICDGSLIWATGFLGFSGLWWIKTPKGANGATPPGIGLGLTQTEESSWRSLAKASFERRKPAPKAAPAALRTRSRRLSHLC